jgi:Protein of unknown function (DUF2750)
MKIISQKEVDNVLKLSPLQRYKYTVKWIADGHTIYTLAKQSTMAIAELDGRKMILFWSAEVFAQLSLKGAWSDYEVRKVSFEAFESEIIPLIMKEDYLLNIFSIEDKSGFVVDLDEFMTDLNEELSNYH